MNKTFVIKREFRSGTLTFESFVSFTVRPDRMVEVHHSDVDVRTPHVMTLEAARDAWRAYTAQKPAAMAGGMVTSWTRVQ